VKRVHAHGDKISRERFEASDLFFLSSKFSRFAIAMRNAAAKEGYWIYSKELKRHFCLWVQKLLCYGFRIESGNYILERGLKESNFHIERN
jgi:hypothetical protein